MNQSHVSSDLLKTLFPDVHCPSTPCGNRVLVQIASPPKTSDGGILYTVDTQDTKKWTQKLAKVIKLGTLAYHHRDNMIPWPEGPWCSVGDYIRVPQYGGVLGGPQYFPGRI